MESITTGVLICNRTGCSMEYLSNYMLPAILEIATILHCSNASAG